MNYRWPRNAQALAHAFVLCRGEVITRERLPVEICHLDSADGAGRRKVKAGRSPSEKEREEIRNALIKTGGKKSPGRAPLGRRPLDD
jgi:DNA-binding NtrC family response regulator